MYTTLCTLMYAYVRPCTLYLDFRYSNVHLSVQLKYTTLYTLSTLMYILCTLKYTYVSTIQADLGRYSKTEFFWTKNWGAPPKFDCSVIVGAAVICAASLTSVDSIPWNFNFLEIFFGGKKESRRKIFIRSSFFESLTRSMTQVQL